VPAFWIVLAGAVAMVLAQDVYPGVAVYHSGWYNVLNIVALLAALWRLRALRKKGSPQSAALVPAAFGGAAVVFAGVVSGLMGPDTHTVVGAPGAAVRDDDVGGSFVFPLNGDRVLLQRGAATVDVGKSRRYTGAFVLWQQPRAVVHVDAADLQGNHLTVTQPTNASFLSPVLLMQQHTVIDGMQVRYDAFSVPAAQRNVKAVLFAQPQVAQLHTDPPIVGKPAVLFAVSDNADRVLPGAIGITASGVPRTLDGLRLTPLVESYPAVVVASAPYRPIAAFGLLCCIASAIGALLKIPYRSRT